MIPDFVHGPMAPVFTAFHADGRIDGDGQRQFLDFMLKRGGMSCFFVRCGLGQMYTFSYEDVQCLSELACNHLAGKAPVLVGTSGIWDHNLDERPDPELFARQSVELSKAAEGHGADAVVLTIPDAIVPPAGQTIADVTLQYFECICEAVRIPIVIYQTPATPPEYRVSVDVARRLADLPNVKGIKASIADAGYILDICWAVAGKDFAFVAGNETSFYAALCCGAYAVIGQGATINPQILKAVQDRFERGDTRGAMDAQRSANLLVAESVKCQEFFKRYAAEKGYEVQPYDRSMKRNAYQKSKGPLTQEKYDAYKHLLESELAKVM
jgi:4-hydroxy-tetrahydrodipicolinate synthase